jgi:uncharacterized membrane protein
MVRNSLKYVSWKDYKAVTADLKRIYQATTEDQALTELERFGHNGVNNIRKLPNHGRHTGSICARYLSIPDHGAKLHDHAESLTRHPFGLQAQKAISKR